MGSDKIHTGPLVSGLSDSKDGRPTISVIIPTWNGGQWLEQLLTNLQHQSVAPDEILIVDSGSSDATLDIVDRFHVRLLSIKQEDFDHGGTRSMAAKHVQGEILVFMTQDAVPEDDTALEKLIAPLMKREDVVAVYGRQLPAPDADLFAEHLRLHNYPDRSYIRCWQDRYTYGFRTVFISNSFAAYRREVLAAHGFFPEKQLFGEDTCAVANLLENGYCVAYVSEARVFHSHNYSLMQDFRRYFDIGVFHTCNSEMLIKFGSPTGAGKKFVRSELAFLCQRGQYHRLAESILRSGAKFVAYQLGTRYKKLPKQLAPFLSLHRRWWS